MILATNLPGFEGYPIASRIEEHFHVPTFLDNDVNVAGMERHCRGLEKEKISFTMLRSPRALAVLWLSIRR